MRTPTQFNLVQHVVPTIKSGACFAKVLTDNSGFVKMEEGVGQGFLR